LLTNNIKKFGKFVDEIVHFTNGQLLVDYLQDSNREKIKYAIILDLEMPIMNGIQTLEIIKNDKNLKKIPILVLTSSDIPEQVEKCYSLGCNMYIVKVINYKKFLQIQKKMCEILDILAIPEV
jgi:CheY-like chemotaxis protein